MAPCHRCTSSLRSSAADHAATRVVCSSLTLICAGTHAAIWGTVGTHAAVWGRAGAPGSLTPSSRCHGLSWRSRRRDAPRRSRFTWRSLQFTLRGHSTSNRRPHGQAGCMRTVGRCSGAPCRPLRPAPSCPRAPRGCACHHSCPPRRLPCVRCPSLGRLEHSGLHVLQVLLPLRTHRFFRGFGVTEVLSQSGREGVV